MAGNCLDQMYSEVRQYWAESEIGKVATNRSNYNPSKTGNCPTYDRGKRK
jgi:hypothetical protein